MLFESIILHMSSQFKGERSSSAIYHLLTGKRSIQTVQDAHTYGLEKYFGIYKSLKQTDFDNKINQLCDEHYLKQNSDLNTVKSTSQGNEQLNKNMENLPFSYFNGLNYHQASRQFNERLLMIIQVLTNSQMKNNTYIPIIDKQSITKWVKRFYKDAKPFVKHYLQLLYKELHLILMKVTEFEANVFVDRLTGFKKYGLSIDQLAINYKRSPNDIRLTLTAINHYILETISDESVNYEILSSIVQDIVPKSLLSYSAKRTKSLIRQQYSISEVAHIRQLRKNTICDHIVEISLYDESFPINRYVNKQTQEDILLAIEQTGSYKLKEIKANVGEQITYFQIRLMLNKVNKTVQMR